MASGNARPSLLSKALSKGSKDQLHLRNAPSVPSGRGLHIMECMSKGPHCCMRHRAVAVQNFRADFFRLNFEQPIAAQLGWTPHSQINDEEK